MKNNLEVKLQKEYPGIWSLLNNKAQNRLPNGIIEYLTKMHHERKAWQALQIPEKYINQLIRICGIRKVADAYRRDLSSVTDENAFLNFAHEIIVCSSMATLSPNIRLRPKSGKGECDFSLQVGEAAVYGEVKRWIDNWWINSNKPRSRLIYKPSTDEVQSNNSLPRAMDLYGKLIDATRQFTEGKINILFIFPRSFGKQVKYLQQALFGDINFFRDPDKVSLEKDGLFATPEGMVISACYLASEDFGIFNFPRSWKNPEAIVSLPSSVETLFKKFKLGILKGEIEKAANDLFAKCCGDANEKSITDNTPQNN